MRPVKNVLLGTALILLASFTFFHHGWANYDQTKELDFTSTIEESKFENPHALITVEYEGEPWTIYLAPTSRMTSRGLSSEAIGEGAEVRLVAYPHKTKKGEMRAERIFVNGEKYELR